VIRRPRIKREDPPEWKLNLVEGNASKHVSIFLAQCKRNPIPDHFQGTGCVMAAGGRSYLREAFITISRIRQEKWDWPIQVWHLGPKELPVDLRRRFDHLNVEFVDAHWVRRNHPARQLGGWELKSYMVAHCPFRNVLLLDSDSAPVRDPFPLFDSPEFLQHGAIMWPDIKPCMQSDRAFGFIGSHKPPNYVEVESGQMMVDKVRCWRAWELVRWMNDYSEFWYRYFHGDKSSFDLAFLRVGQPFLMAPRCDWRGYGIEQHWFDGETLFEHRLDRKRNPNAFISPEDQFYGSVFDRWDVQQTLAYA
jgi:hypothetical protein